MPSAFAELLTKPTVTEEISLRSRIGFMAFHGGMLEKVTDVVAREAAEQCGASFYGVIQSDNDDVNHLPSTTVCPTASPVLAEFLDHVELVIAMHGYGRDHLRHTVLLGGRNREFAAHIAATLTPLLPNYTMLDDLAEIPKELAGQHPSNPVNLPPQAGVQIELPPFLRWNIGQHNWSDHGEAGRAPQVQILIDGLSAAVANWPG